MSVGSEVQAPGVCVPEGTTVLPGSSEDVDSALVPANSPEEGLERTDAIQWLSVSRIRYDVTGPPREG